MLKCKLSRRFIIIKENGQNKTNRQEVHRPEGAQEATRRPEDRQEVSSSHHRSQEAPQIQARNSRPQGNQKVPKVHRPPHQKTPLPENGQGNRSRVETRTQIPIICCPRPPRIR